ncbi:acyl-CoA dehydrogenase [Skermania sp. ID1734]|uniref:acyl-CoA dehydrogenase family protein n=1 Tax=Skermania sp. ID1734 TaxID=2597516 RepID=UPI00117F1505|nr:acyl-CoA dehydrogenase family protein [Skermania sp. ID1734]TSD95678.1 acyl-CoA dehydrogenase [Skermania sp. ID1734]
MIGRITDEQRDLVATVRSLLAKHAGLREAIASDSGYDEKLWRLLCEQVGVAALAIPEDFGGVGASIVESHLVLSELGSVLAATPMLGSVAICAPTLLALGDEKSCAQWLPEIAAGSAVAALCWAGEAGWDTPGVSADSAGRLSGSSQYVLDGHIADVLVVVASTDDGYGFFEVDPATTTRAATRGMDPTRRFTSVSFDATPARRLDNGNGGHVIDRVRVIACAALAAEQVGAADRCLANTVAYTKSRVQFGRPIGSFQALKHRMADMYALVETARSMSYAATAALANDDPDAAESAFAAKIYCSEALETVAAESVQLHGGIAITWEHDAHLYFKRAHADAQLFGAPRCYVEKLSQHVVSSRS